MRRERNCIERRIERCDVPVAASWSFGTMDPLANDCRNSTRTSKTMRRQQSRAAMRTPLADLHALASVSPNTHVGDHSDASRFVRKQNIN
jgi:hypothetical protein